MPLIIHWLYISLWCQAVQSVLKFTVMTGDLNGTLNCVGIGSPFMLLMVLAVAESFGLLYVCDEQLTSSSPYCVVSELHMRYSTAHLAGSAYR